MRLLPWLACSLVLFLLGAAPHTHLVVCLAKLGLVAAAPEQKSCCTRCCRDHAEPNEPKELQEPARPGEQRLGKRCPAGCCVDLCTEIELGPTPRDGVPPMPDAEAPAPAMQLAFVLPLPRSPREWPHDTGPPRIDARTDLRKTTVLRL